MNHFRSAFPPVNHRAFGVLGSLALGLLVTLVPLVSAQECLRYGEYLHLTGTADTPGVARDVFVAGDYAYIAVDIQSFPGSGRLEIVDIADPASPQSVGSVGFADGAYGVTVSGHHAFVAAYAIGLVVIDVADPSAPVVVGTADTPSAAYGVAVAGDYAYVASLYAGLQVIDVSVPSSPTVVGAVDTPSNAFGVVIQGNYAFLADDWTGVVIIDVSDPESPQIRHEFDTRGRSRNVTISGQHLYVADGYAGGLQVIDISEPLMPTIAGSLDLPHAFDVTLAGQYAYVTAYQSLHVVDVTDLTTMQILGEIGLGNPAHGVAVQGDNVYVAATGGGVQVIDATVPYAPPLVGLVPTQYSDTGGFVTIGGGYAYRTWSYCDFAGNCYAGLQVIDLAIPSAPQIVAALEFTPGAQGVAVAGDFIYVAAGDGLLVIDVSVPSAPLVVETLPSLLHAQNVVVSGEYAYVTHDVDLYVLDISTPGSPQITGDVELPNSGRDIAVAGDFAYVAVHGSGMQVVDVSQPDLPHVVAAVEEPGYARSVAVSGDHAYVIGTYGVLFIVDVSQTLSPQIVGTVDMLPGQYHGVAVAEGIAYVAALSCGLQVIDVSDPQDAHYEGVVITGDYAYRVALAGDHVYMTNLALLTIAHRQCSPVSVEPETVPPARQHLSVFPNPFNPRTTISFTLTRSQSVRISVHDMRGRQVVELIRGQFRAGMHTVTWGGRDTTGRAVASGAYLVRAVTDDGQISRKVLLVR